MIVGRDSELERLTGALDSVDSDGGPRFVEISGEAGIGKTTVVDALCDRAGARDFLVLRGHAAEFERGVPFAPVVDALDAYLAANVPERLHLPEEDLRHELGAIFPSLATEGRPASGVHDERYRAYRAVRELLDRMTVRRPVVLAIDDVQWADDASAELMSALLQKPPEARLMIVLAGRSGQMPDPIEPALGAVERRRQAERIRLGPLDESAVTQLLGDDVDPRDRRLLYEASGGNPFYMEQLVRNAGRSGATGPGAATVALEVPPAVSAALSEEIAALPECERTVLQSAAVAGQRFDLDLVAAIAELGEPRVLQALDELLDRELVRATDEPRRFVFRHPLVWRAVYEGARGGWRLAAHRAAADALAVRGAPPQERAHHVEHAAATGDVRAVAVLREAGSRVAQRSPATAVRWFRGALRLMPEVPSLDDDRRALLRELASALRGSGDLDAAREALRDALDLLPPDAVGERARLDAACATVESWLGRPEDAHRRLRHARAAVGERRCSEAVLLDIRLALHELNRLEFESGVAVAEQALATAEELRQTPLVAEAAAALALGHGLAGDTRRARARRDQAVAALDGLGQEDLVDRIETFFYLGWAETYIDEHEAAVATAERGLELSRATGQGHLLVPLMLTRSLPLDILGRIAESVAAGEEAIEAARTSPNPQYLFWALWECAYSHGMAGNLDRARELAEESLSMARGLAPNFLFWSQPGTTYGWVVRELGDAERGLALELEAIGGIEGPLISAYERVISYQQLTDAFIGAGRADDAEECLRLGDALADRLGLTGSYALMAQARAELLLVRGRPEEARDSAAAMRPRAAERGLRLDAANLARLEGMALAALGDRAAAVDLLREAEGEFASFPSLRARDACRRELRRLGARHEPRGATATGEGIDALTEREREIAELVADRRMNKEIAAALFLSEKTIESHLRSIFRKLEVASRVDVARAIEAARTAG